ncbi:MAG TPA: TlpA disulfide reductase family protein [Candidatus Angelobacter sp.]|nr:TlpA disulfide reductase family protein [Candidatus Angelobacter sp.]
MKKSVIFVLFIVVGVTALLISGKYMSHPKGTANAGFQADPGGRLNGRQAPDFELNLLEEKGKTLRLSSLRGKAVIVNFWATWCEPCKVEMPWLIDLQKKYGPQGLQILGVAMDDTDEKTISEFAHKMGVNYPVLMGTEKVADLYGGIDGMPTLFFVDRSGKVVDYELGLRSLSIIEDNIKKSLAQGGPAPASGQ